MASGRFFHAYTALECELNDAVYAAITRFTKHKTRTRVLLAVLGGQRMSAAKDTLNRLLRATNANPKRLEFARALFHQLGEIQFLRDRLAHSITTVSDDNPPQFINMNFVNIRELSKFEDITFDVDVLEAATLDLYAMRGMARKLVNHYVGKGSQAVPKLPAWHYKPSMLTRDRPLSHGNQKPRKPPPQSSRA